MSDGAYSPASQAPTSSVPAPAHHLLASVLHRTPTLFSSSLNFALTLEPCPVLSTVQGDALQTPTLLPVSFPPTAPFSLVL